MRMLNAVASDTYGTSNWMEEVLKKPTSSGLVSWIAWNTDMTEKIIISEH